MVDPTGDARYLSHANIEALWAVGNPQAMPVIGSPWCEIRLDPPDGTITLRTIYQLPEPDLAKLKNLEFTAVATDAGDIAEITVRVGGNLPGAYGLLATIADGLQVEGAPLASAVAAGVASHKELFAARTGLSETDEIGLFGELKFLEFLIGAVGAGPALASWQGPRSEEHDFVFKAIHLEVKTTATERRQHVINGLTQLVPVPDVPLSLVSIQITRTDEGPTLPELVARVRSAAAGHAPQVDALLELNHLDRADADLYETAWALRSRPRAYPVDDTFPAMTPDRIAPVVPSFSLISRLSYSVDVTDFPNHELPVPLAGFVETDAEPDA